MATHNSGATIPTDFLATTPNITIHPIDFANSPLPEYAGLYALVLDNVLTPAECRTLVSAAEASTPLGWERAMVNIGGGEQALFTEVRSCGRIILDSPDIVGRVWKRIEHLPEVQQILQLQAVPKVFGDGPVKRGEVWHFTRPNERMRFLKYVGGEYFRPHYDGSYETTDRSERSYFTLHLYLNDSAAEGEAGGLVGGATTFHSMDDLRRMDVAPKCGRILLFQHRGLLHSGDDVVEGVKYTMRTDLMYALKSPESEERSNMPVLEEPKQAWDGVIDKGSK
ncbi:hypothetical protein LTR08_000552 [Meristemomyces frigidus]|nr:hypothetical protein LTR08_000552 [Meristemomyces frigidus]